MARLTSPDWIVLILYIVILYGSAFYHSHADRKNLDSFILAGRKLGLPGFIATLVATWYGGILGVGENTFRYGIQTWFIFGLPYYGFALCFAWWIAPRIRQFEFRSIPDHFDKTSGPAARVFSGIFVFLLASPAPYILSIGILLHFLFPISLFPALWVAGFVSVLYIWFGGFGAVVRTDMVQFILMFTGFILVVIFAWFQAGSPIHIWAQLPAMHRSPFGGNTFSYILVWFFIALWTFVDPGFYQRCAAVRDPRIARQGIVLSVLFWFIFDSLTLLSGLYARVLLTTNQPLFVFPLLGQAVLPPVFLGLFLVSLLAILMSTIDSLGLISAITIGQDLWGLPDSDSRSVRRIQIGLIISIIVAVLLAWAIPSVVNLWYVLGSLVIPGLLLPFLLSFTSWSLTSRQVQILLVVPTLTSLTWWLGKIQFPGFFRIEPFYPGLAVSLGLTALYFGIRTFSSKLS
ncbi:MAG: sodium:solute symporter family protein [FCB group bacterium]|nr:sodium:solute symporter family protein [FCB group bacterium]